MAADEISQLTLHAAWSAANERSLLWQSASRDRRVVEEAALRLARRYSTEVVEAMKGLALGAAWHAANQRRFFYSDAERDRRGVEFYADLLERLTSRELAQLIKRLSWDAAWHAANSRSMMWKDAAKDMRNFQRGATELSAFLGSDDAGSEGFRTPLGSDSENEAGSDFPMPRGGVPGGEDEGISNLRNVSVQSQSVLEEVILGWRETSNMTNGHICAASFVKAALGTIAVFDLFGKLLQSFQADMRKNATMIQQHLSHDRISLQDLIDGECRKAGSYAKAIVEGSAAMGLLWLLRALRLLEKTLHAVLEDRSQPLHRCIQTGYEGSLKPHHNWMTRNVIQAAIRAAPSREHFVSKLCPETDAMERIQEFLKFYSPVLCKAHEYLLTCGLETT